MAGRGAAVEGQSRSGSSRGSSAAGVRISRKRKTWKPAFIPAHSAPTAAAEQRQRLTKKGVLASFTDLIDLSARLEKAGKVAQALLQSSDHRC